jgi:hypothetical protein
VFSNSLVVDLDVTGVTDLLCWHHGEGIYNGAITTTSDSGRQLGAEEKVVVLDVEKGGVVLVEDDVQ